jgi:hypothetical protein
MLKYQDWGQKQTLLVYVKDPTDAQVSGLEAGANSSSLREGYHRCSGIRTGGQEQTLLL